MRTIRLLLALTLTISARAAVGQAARVIVNQRELRVEFPRDTSRHWGWAPGDQSRYTWSMAVNAVNGHQTFSLDVTPDDARGRDFPSLEAFVAAGRLWLCETWPRDACRSRPTTSAFVDHGRVVLQLRDPAIIARMFGLRPTTVRLRQRRPGPASGIDTIVSVTYRAPQIPEPNAATLAEAERARQPAAASARRAWSDVVGGRRHGDTLSLAVGDTLTLRLQDSSCAWDVCTVIEGGVAGAWMVDDSTIVDLTPVATGPTPRTGGTSARTLIRAKRGGRTTLRVTLPAPVRKNVVGTDSTTTVIELPVLVAP